jgi:GTP cyclohydrolase IA
MDVVKAEAGARAMLSSLGFDVDSPSQERTPHRMVAALAELASSVDGFDAGEALARRFDPPSDVPQMIFLTGIPFTSLCEHHVLPFTGTATVAYLPAPGAKVAGVSKLARLVQGLAARPQMQERLGTQVVEAIGKHLDTQGAGCLIEAVHTCMTLRGPQAAGARMITSHLAGCFFDTPVRGEFLALARPCYPHM